MNKKLLAVLAASASALMLCTACGSQPAESSTPETTAAPVTTAAPAAESAAETAESVAAENIEFEERVIAEPGDAILAIVDGQWYVQYWGGKDTDILAYDAGIAHINGDGDYTVSVNVGTKGAQFDITGDPENGYTCGGLEFAAIQVLEGTKLFPEMCIEVKEIRVDGKPIETVAKNYTSSDDGVEMRTNIYNHYVSNFPEDAHTAEGAVTGTFGEYSSMIVNTADFAKWTTVEVDFTVTGTGNAGAAEGGENAETSAAEESSAEEATESTAA